MPFYQMLAGEWTAPRSLYPLAPYQKRKYKPTCKWDNALNSYIKLLLKNNGCEPNDVDVKAHLDFQDQSDTIEYDRINTNIAGISLAMDIEIVIYVVGIVVDDPLEWLAILVESKKGIYSSFEDCVVVFHEGMFTRVGLWPLFYEFEVDVLKYLKVTPSHLHIDSW